MKQLLLIERGELATLKRGATLKIVVGGQGVLIGLEGRKPLARAVGRENSASAPKKKRASLWHCRESQCKNMKPFKSQSDYMKHRRATHQQRVGGAVKKAAR